MFKTQNLKNLNKNSNSQMIFLFSRRERANNLLEIEKHLDQLFDSAFWTYPASNKDEFA
jgi:hypothetical protein